MAFPVLPGEAAPSPRRPRPGSQGSGGGAVSAGVTGDSRRPGWWLVPAPLCPQKHLGGRGWTGSWGSHCAGPTRPPSSIPAPRGLQAGSRGLAASSGLLWPGTGWVCGQQPEDRELLPILTRLGLCSAYSPLPPPTRLSNIYTGVRLYTHVLGASTCSHILLGSR